MKLKVEQPPVGYDSDKAIIMIDENGEFILIGCSHAYSVASEIAHRVNMYDFFVDVLTPFKSSEMGNLLIDVVTTDVVEGYSQSDVAGNLRKLINAIDVIIKGVELHKERADAEKNNEPPHAPVA